MPDFFETQLEDRVIERESSRQVGYTRRIEPTVKRIRAYYNGVPVADSTRVKLLLEAKHMPVYYFPVEDIATDLFTPSGRPSSEKTFLTLQVGDRTAKNAAWSYDTGDLAGHVAFYWKTMDAWYEEDDEVYSHPKDPYHRVDVLTSSRHVQIVVMGELVAETRRPRLLVETNLPPRWYIPKQDVRLDLLRPSTTTSTCPYKGRAAYWSIQVGDRLMHDVTWAYPFPSVDCTKIENLLCFFDELADSVHVDGELLDRPKTAWSRTPKITTV